jgi:hypothetical protein
MDDRQNEWYGREDRRRNEGRRFSDRGTEPPRPYRHADLRTVDPSGGYREGGPYRGGPLGSELRDPYELERPHEGARPQRDRAYERPRRYNNEMIYYSPYGEPTPSRGFAGRGPKGYQRSDERIREDICERLADDPPRANNL